ncbi:tape measure protein [Desertivirga xinjiangensis]|uniref:tape measure protein n=1 Tax=Desertivirga xinjiangensis TaxID=539206 RepID=UPI00210A977B|nr:tape measure protein [Pedobacter xinjiangensis]
MGVNISGGELEWDAIINGSQFNGQIRKMENDINNFSRNMKNGGSEMDRYFQIIGGAVAGYLSVQALTDFSRKVIDITAEFQKFQAVLTNTLGSEALADSAMSQIQDFAAKTPFSVRTLTDAFVKLANQGFVPTGKQMRQLGDLASSTGKDFNQLAEAILDAQTGEFERLKEFGIKAKDAGDKVVFTFKGVATEVDKTSSSIRNYITSLGDAEGVSGSMAAISGTLGGQISNLEDNWDQLLKTIGEGTDGVFSSAITALSKMLDAVTEYVDKANIASKYNLSSSKPNASGLLGGPFSGLMSLLNSNPDQAGFVQELNKGLSEQNNIFLENAKYFRQYQEQYKKLEKERAFALKGVNDPNLRKAIDAEYQKAKKIINDSAVQYVKNKNKKADSNFGTSKNGKTDEERRLERISNAYNKLQSDLNFINLDKKLSLEEIDEQKINAYESLLKSLLDNGIKPTDRAIVDVTDKIFKFNQELNSIEGNKFQIGVDARELEDKAKQSVKEFQDLVKAGEDVEATVGNINKEITKGFLPKVKSAETRFRELGDKAYGVADGLWYWSEALHDVDPLFSKVLGKIGEISNGIGNVSKGLEAMQAAKATEGSFDNILSGFNTIGSAIGVVKGIVSLFDKSEEKRRKAEEQRAYSQDLQIKAIEAQTKAMERQLSVIKDLYGAERLEKYGQSLEEITRKREELQNSLNGKYMLSDDKSDSDVLARFNSGQFNLDEMRKERDQLAKEVENDRKYLDDLKKKGLEYRYSSMDKFQADNRKRNLDVTQYYIDIAESAASLQGKTVEELTQLLDSGRLDEVTRTAVQNLITFEQQYKDTLNAMREEATGIGFNEVVDSIVDMFARGNAAAEDFGKNFEEIMKKSILNSFKRNSLEKELQKFYQDFAAKAESGGGLDQGELGSLKTLYDAIIANSKKQFEELEKATGMDFASESASSSNSLSGAYKSASQESIDLLAGQTGGMRLAQLQTNLILTSQKGILQDQLNIAMAGIRHWQAIEANTLRTANNTDRMQSIESSLKSISEKMDKNSNALAANGKIGG